MVPELLHGNVDVSIVMVEHKEIRPSTALFVQKPDQTWKQLTLKQLENTNSYAHFCSLLGIQQGARLHLSAVLNTPGGDMEAATCLTGKNGILKHGSSASFITDIALSAGTTIAWNTEKIYAPDNALFMFHDGHNKHGRTEQYTLEDDLLLLRKHAASLEKARPIFDQFEQIINRQDDNNERSEIWYSGMELKQATLIENNPTSPHDFDALLSAWETQNIFPEALRTEIKILRTCYALQQYVREKTNNRIVLHVSSVTQKWKVTHDTVRSSVGFRTEHQMIDAAITAWKEEKRKEDGQH